jgi:hypothetical protein
VQSQPEISRCVEELSVISVAAGRSCGWIDTWATGLMKFSAYLPATRSDEIGYLYRYGLMTLKVHLINNVIY